MKVNLSKYKNNGLSRKIKVEIQNFDTYDLYHSLAHIILPALVQFKEEKNGVPSAFVDDHDHVRITGQLSLFDYTDEENETSYQNSSEKWNEALNKMIWSFQQILFEEYDSKYHHGTPEFDWCKTDQLVNNPVTGKLEKTYKLVDKNPEDHWYDFVGHHLHEERIQEGLELFGKHFKSLWT